MKRIKIFLCAISVVCGFSACSDFFDQSSEQVIFTEKEHLNTATDTVYSVTGIINKLQAIADQNGARLEDVKTIIRKNNNMGLLLANILRRKAAHVVLDSAK